MASRATKTAPTAEVYQYKSLDEKKQQIRLLRLWRPSSPTNTLSERSIVHCKLETFDMITAPEYITLSYTWGDPSNNRYILVNDKPMSIRMNLFDFLYAFRSDDANIHYLWIDQICINQQDTAERNYQVRLMAQIYGACIHVIAWLDLSSSRAARSYLKNRNAVNTKAILENRYFTRLWIVQEVLLPKRARIMCGNTWIEWDSLMRAALWAGFLELPTLRPMANLLTYQFAHAEPIQPGYAHLLSNMLSQFSSMDCENPREKLYGMLGLVAEDQRPVVNYDNTVEEVYLDAIRMLGAHRCLNASNWWWQDLPIRMGVSLAYVVSMQPFITDLLACGLKENKIDPIWTLQDMGFEKADSTRHRPDRWWYEYEGVRYYHDCHSPMEHSEDSEAILQSLLDATPERGSW